GSGPATTFQSPPRGRSNSRNSPRIEFHVGAIPRMSCVQSSGMPSARALLVSQISKRIGKQRKIDIGTYKNWADAQVVRAVSTAAVSAGRYFTPISHAKPEAKTTPEKKRNPPCILL